MQEGLGAFARGRIGAEFFDAILAEAEVQVFADVGALPSDQRGERREFANRDADPPQRAAERFAMVRRAVAEVEPDEAVVQQFDGRIVEKWLGCICGHDADRLQPLLYGSQELADHNRAFVGEAMAVFRFATGQFEPQRTQKSQRDRLAEPYSPAPVSFSRWFGVRGVTGGRPTPRGTPDRRGCPPPCPPAGRPAAPR